MATKEELRRLIVPNGGIPIGHGVPRLNLASPLPTLTDDEAVLVARDGVAEIERLTAAEAELKVKLAQKESALAQAKEESIYTTRTRAAYTDDIPPPQQLHQQACTGDTVTVNSWRETWIKNIRLNHATFGGFRQHSIGSLLGKGAGSAAIVVGSGPDLKRNGHLLAKKPKGVTIVSALHNFGYMTDLGVDVDYYMTLDAGPVVIPEVYEGGTKLKEDGTKDEDHYWAATKDKTLLAFVATDPELFRKWQGKVYLFAAPVPDTAVMDAQNELEPDFHHYISAGGNVLGGSTYFARAILGCFTIVWVGNSQSFSYNKKFYSWQTGLDDNPGPGALRVPDIYGIPVYTWPSYFNFKCWMDFVSICTRGIYINSTEGGIVGAYPQGNIRSILQVPLDQVLAMFTDHEQLRPIFEENKLPTNGATPVLF